MPVAVVGSVSPDHATVGVKAPVWTEGSCLDGRDNYSAVTEWKRAFLVYGKESVF